MSTVPVVGVLFRKLHKWYHKSSNHKCHQPGCDAHHLLHEHTEEVLMPNPPGREVLSMEEVDAQWGPLPTIFLMFDRKLLGTKDFLPSSEFMWFVSPDDTLSARWKNKFFLWVDNDWILDPEFIKQPEPRDDTVKLLRCDVENMVGLLHSITRLSVEDGELEVWFDDEENPFTSVEFVSGSFTRDLLELMDLHLHEQNTADSHSGLDQEQETDPGSPQQN